MVEEAPPKDAEVIDLSKVTWNEKVEIILKVLMGNDQNLVKGLEHCNSMFAGYQNLITQLQTEVKQLRLEVKELAEQLIEVIGKDNPEKQGKYVT